MQNVKCKIKTSGAKKQRAAEIEKFLTGLYPEAQCSLRAQDAFELLVSAVLAAQCTDKRVNMVTPELFRRFPSPREMAAAEVFEIEEIIKSTGFWRAKAKNISALSKDLYENYGGIVPDSIEELIKLPGVGRKIANLVVGDVYGKPSIVIDTHAKRILYRLGLTKQTDPVKIEFEMMKILNPETSGDFCHRLVLFGREYCTARNPRCAECAESIARGEQRAEDIAQRRKKE